MRRLLIAILALTAAGCSRSDSHHLQRDVKAIGADLAAQGRSVRDDPNIRQAGADLHAAARDTGAELHHAAEETADQARAAADEARDQAKLAADQARDHAHDARDRSNGDQ